MRVFPVVLGALTLAGCATYGPPRTGELIVGSAAAHATAGQSPAAMPKHVNGLPQFVIPVSGGPMLVALPLGGSFFLPVDGSPPVTGIAAVPQ
jgi:hypothetical protein